MTTWNPSDKSTDVYLAGDDLGAGYQTLSSDAAPHGVRGTDAAAAGQFYVEFSIDVLSGTVPEAWLGLCTAAYDLDAASATDACRYESGGDFVDGGVGQSFAAFTQGDVVGLAVDLDAGKAWVAKNNAWQGSGDPAAGTNPAWTFSGLSLYPLAQFYAASDDADIYVTARFLAAEQTYSAPSGFGEWGSSGGPVTPSWALDLDVAHTTATPSWDLALSVSGLATPSWDLSLAVHDVAAMAAARAYAWSVGLSVAGVDWSDRLTGPVRIDAEAGAAALASFTVRLPAGAFDPADWTRAEVALEYIWQGTAHIAMFAGWVDTIELDDARKTLTARCVDRRQALLLAASQDQIAAWLPGSYWSEGWFDADADNLRHAEDRLSTLQADFDVDAHGTPRLTAWTAKASPDWTITLPEADTVRWSFARAADLVHRVDVQFRYRFSRLRLREARIKYVFDLMDMVTDLVAMPTSSLVEEAIESAGWEVLDDPVYKRPPEYFEVDNVFYLCDAVNGVQEATARIGKRFAQSVEETYALTLAVAESGIDERQTRKIAGALEAAFDARAWEDDPAAAPALASPGLAVETAYDATTDPDTGRDGLETALRCGLAMAARILADSHRQNEVSFNVPLNPFLSRADTLRLNLTTREATGKVRRLVHELDLTDGRAITAVTLALSRPHLTRPAASSAHTPPDYPSIPAIGADIEAAHYLELSTHIGGKSDSPAYDEDWSGWIINVPSENKVQGYRTNWGASTMTASGHVYGDDYATAWAITSSEEPPSIFDGTLANPDYTDATAYPVQFRLVPPAVEDAARDNLDIELSGDYLLRLEEDDFSYTVG